MPTRPMKAAMINKVGKNQFIEIEEAVDRLRFDEGYYLGTPKIDGQRALLLNGELLSSSFKPFRNRHIKSVLEKVLPKGADGEVVVGDFNETSSKATREDGEPDFQFYMFDIVVDVREPYEVRTGRIKKIIKTLPSFVVPLVPIKLVSPEAILDFEEGMLSDGYEGIVLRTPHSPYKSGRSTLKQEWALKVKRFEDSEAIILGVLEGETNMNPQKVNELGLHKRSHAKSGMVNTGLLGSFVVKDIYSDVEFKCGTGRGMTLALRKEIWNNRKDYIGKVIKYRHFPKGVKDKPRFPVWVGFRDPDDI